MPPQFEFRLRIRGPKTTQVFAIPVGGTSIGRQPGNDLILDDSQVSRRHAEIVCTESECHLTDLGSSNGTRVNGEKLVPNVPVLLPDQAVIRIGPYELTLEQKAVESEPPLEELAEPEPPLEPEISVEEPAVVEAEMETPVEPRKKRDRTKRSPDKSEPPPPPPVPPDRAGLEPEPAEASLVPPGLSIYGERLLNYLPGIYHTDFMARFLGIFESILTPIEWSIDNFDLYFDPGTAPADFLPWLANWFGLAFDPTWSQEQQRTLVREAHKIYARRGTRWALSRVLEIYTGVDPEITDTGEDLEAYTFRVRLQLPQGESQRQLLEMLIDAHKPAHTSYTLEFTE